MVDLRKSLVTLGLALAVLVPAGCGVPSSSGPIIDGNVSIHEGGAGGDVTDLPAGPGGIIEPDKLVDAYLNAVAGQVDSTAQKKAASAFMTAAAERKWQPRTQITVVRRVGALLETPDGNGQSVDGEYQAVGVFSPDKGTLNPPPANATTLRLHFLVVSNADPPGGLSIASSPDGMYMSETALGQYYRQHSIYFWDNDRDGLIPDLRYLPRTLSLVQQETQIVNWVLAGPSDWMNQAASTLVSTTLLDPNVVNSGLSVVVNLAPTARSLDPAGQLRLVQQLRWSFGELHPSSTDAGPGPVELQIDHQKLLTDDSPAFRGANLAADRPEAVAFGIDDGVVRQIDGVEPLILGGAANSSVLLAAVNQDESAAALVREAADGVELWVRRSTEPKSKYVRVATGRTMARPVWLLRPKGELAVVVDGKLTFIDAGNKAHSVALPALTTITAFSMAPEGQRIALVDPAGRLYVSIVTWQGNLPSLIPLRELNPRPLLATATAVAWSAEDQLAIGGVGGEIAQIIEVNVDGSQALPLESYGKLTITQVSAYPYDPLDRLDSGPIMAQTSNGAYNVRPRTGSLMWGRPAQSDTPPVAPFFLD